MEKIKKLRLEGYSFVCKPLRAYQIYKAIRAWGTCNSNMLISFWYPPRLIQVRFPSDWSLPHGDNRSRHSANHSLVPDMHLCVC